jgi:predicted house-cleaning noncanonical NTP pyrophosphatase (MazG superfamily)
MSPYHKLVRDKIPEILDRKGITYEKHTASDEEYKSELLKKLVEESREFAEAGALEELADVLEVLAALKSFPEYSLVEEVRKRKLEEKGGFSQKIILKGEK